MPEHKPTYEEALSLLHEFNQSESLLKHAYAVEGVKRYLACKAGEDEEKWGIIGLMHDRRLTSGGEAILRSEGDGVAAVQRRIGGEVLVARDLEVDLSRRLTKRGVQIIKFTPTEYKLLSYLVRNNSRVLSHVELLQHVWGADYGQETEYLHTFIRQIRSKIENGTAKPQFILTEPGVGYRFVECKSPAELNR